VKWHENWGTGVSHLYFGNYFVSFNIEQSQLVFQSPTIVLV